MQFNVEIMDAIERTYTDTIMFDLVWNDVVLTKFKSLNTTKVTGYDNIPSKMIKMAADYLSSHVTLHVNRCIKEATFPELLTRAEVTPVLGKTIQQKQ